MPAESFVIERILDAPVDKVWNAWTQPEKIKQWWGPKDFTAPSISSDLTVGGKYLYCMRGPKGTEFDKDMYSGGVYLEIIPRQKIVATDYFADAEGNKVSAQSMGMPENMPSEFSVITRFTDLGGGKTRLTIEYPATAAQLAAMRKNRMDEGWNQSLDKLERVVVSS